MPSSCVTVALNCWRPRPYPALNCKASAQRLVIINSYMPSSAQGKASASSSSAPPSRRITIRLCIPCTRDSGCCASRLLQQTSPSDTLFTSFCLVCLTFYGFHKRPIGPRTGHARFNLRHIEGHTLLFDRVEAFYADCQPFDVEPGRLEHV